MTASVESVNQPHNVKKKLRHWFLLKDVVQSSVLNCLAFAHVCFWKYSWNCYQTSYEWTQPINWNKIEEERVDWSQDRTWSCCSQVQYAGFSLPAARSSSVRNRTRITGLTTNLCNLCTLIIGSTCCRHKRKLDSLNFSKIGWKEGTEEVENAGCINSINGDFWLWIP